jgi:pimeloyl-ACP methyl ester carboxylesterase
MLFERATITGLLLSATVAGASFHKWQQARLRRLYRRHNLHAYQASLDGGSLHYWAGGKPGGKPVLLIHGFGADAMWGWATQVPLAKKWFLLAPDLLWFGKSHTDIRDYSSVHQAETLVQLLDHLAIDKVDAVGISYGGFVALEMANGWPDRLGKVVLVDSPGHTFTLDDYQDLLDRNDIDSVSDLVVPGDPTGVRRLIQLAFHRPPPIPMWVARDIYQNMFSTWKEQKVRLLDDLLQRAATIDPDDYALQHDLMLLWGEHDVLFPPHLAWRLANQLGPRARVSILPKANHAPNLERPMMFNQRLSAFLDD